MNRNEKVLLIINHTPSEDQEHLRKVLETATEEQLERLVRSAQGVAAKNVAELEMKTAQAKLLLLQNGLMQTESNFLILQAHLGDYYTFDQARRLIESNSVVKQGLIWRGIPFAQYNKQIAEQQEADAREQAKDRERHQKQRAIFNAAVRELLRHGINVASTDANYHLVEEHLHLHAEFNIQNVVDAIKNAGLAFSPNDPQQVQSMDQADRTAIYNSIKLRLAYRPDLIEKAKEKIAQLSIPELRDRVAACTTLANDYSKDPRSQDPVFASHFASLSSTADLQAKAAVVLENRRLRSLSPQQLRAEAAAARGQQPQQSQGFPVLGPEFSGPELVKMCGDKDKIRHMIKHYGREQIDRRLAEYQQALKSTGWSHRMATEELETLKETV